MQSAWDTEVVADDAFDRVGAAVTRVLRAALSGASDMRAAQNGEQMLDELERAVARVLREAQNAADEIVSRAHDSTSAPRTGGVTEDSASSAIEPTAADGRTAPETVAPIPSRVEVVRTAAADPVAVPALPESVVVVRQRVPRYGGPNR